MPHSIKVPVEATIQQWGDLCFAKREYRPLEEVNVRIQAPARGARKYRLEWHDGLGRKYGEHAGELTHGRATCRFLAGGFPGMQFVRLWFDPGVTRKHGAVVPEHPAVRHWFESTSAHDRMACFSLRAETTFRCGHADLDALFPLSRASLLLNRQRSRLPGATAETVGYTTADSFGVWLRDHFYSSLGFALWEPDIKSGYEGIFRRQDVTGAFPDSVDTHGIATRTNTESDLEYIAVLALYNTWMITGDDAWLRKNLPVVERGLRYLMSHPKRWDKKTGLVRRGHTCDTWDFDIDLFDDWGADSPAVAATCDQSGLYLALRCLAEIHAGLGRQQQSARYEKRARAFRQRAVHALWDGEKFQHHLHLDPFDHGSFDESKQLAMGNVWAMTRGLASRAQCRRILETYRARWRQTGHRFPWWSLEPGYPVELGKCLQLCQYFLRPGGYANGGMMPFVGAALSLAAFENGEEAFGARLLCDYAKFFRAAHGNAYTWYWPNMEPGFRCGTRNTTPHDGWGIGHWVETLLRGLAGIRITGPGLATVEISPRWPAIGSAKAEVVAHYPACDRYVAYQWEQKDATMRLRITGAAEMLRLRLLIPDGQRVARLTLNGRRVVFRQESVAGSRYALLRVRNAGVNEVAVVLRKSATKRAPSPA